MADDIKIESMVTITGEEYVRLMAENAKLRAALEEITLLPGEINHSNYDHDDVVALNNSFAEAFHIACAALGGEGD